MAPGLCLDAGQELFTGTTFGGELRCGYDMASSLSPFGTLIDRIHRIEAETGIDLSDPNERLHLHLLIKAMELEELIQEQ